MAARCAWPATAATAWPRSTASPTCGRARRPARPGMAVVRHPAGRHAATPRRGAAGPRLDAGSAWRSSSAISRWTSRSSAADRREADGRGRANGPGKTVRRPRRRGGRRGRRDLRRPHGHRPDRATGCSTSMPHEIVVATGAAEIQPVCPGNDLAGHRDGPCRARSCTPPASTWAGSSRSGRRRRAVRRDRRSPRPVRGRRTAASGPSSPPIRRLAPRRRRPPTPSSLGLGRAPRDLLARMAGAACRVDRRSAQRPPTSHFPPPPTEGIVCGCMGTTVEDLADAWDRGYTELELLKRSSQAGLGPCQGGACLPHVRVVDRRPHRRGAGPLHRPARRRARSRSPRPPPTATSMPSGETPLHDEHLALGARMDRFGGWWRPWHYGDAVAGVLGRPRGRLDRRRQHARQAGRLRAGRRRAPRAALPLPRRGHQARPIALRAAAQRARPRHGRRDDPARVGDAVRPVVHVRRRGQRRDVAPRLDRGRGASASTSSTGRCRSPRSTSPGRWPGPC